MAVRSLVRWGSRHGLAGLAIRAGARRGDLHARLVTEAAAHADPHLIHDEVRRRAAIVPGRFAMATARHQVVAEILRHEDFHAGFPVGALPRAVAAAHRWSLDPMVLGPIEPPSLLVVDGAEHTRYRRLVSKAFTARAVDALAADVEGRAVQLLDRLAATRSPGAVDLVPDYAAALPVQVIAGILGVPVAMQETFLHWGQDLAPSLDIGVSYRGFRRFERALRALNTWLLEHFAQLRSEPGDDLLSRVILAGRAEDGPELTDPELTAVAGLVLAAGFETTVNLIGNAAVLLLGRPDQLAALRAEPAGWRNAVEETLRFDPPVQNTARHAVRDTVVHGVPVQRHQLVALLLAGANRDPAVFTDPHAFDVRRENAREHLAFSAGPHYCLGAALARLEGEVGLRLLFERFPALAAAGPPVRRPTRTLRGWAAIPVLLGAPAGQQVRPAHTRP